MDRSPWESQYEIQTLSREDGRRVFKPRGDLDWSASMTLRRVAVKAMLEGDEVLIDLSRLSFIDAVGLSAIVDCLRQARSVAGTVTLCNATPQVMRRIDLVTVPRPGIGWLGANADDAA